jgi:GT2 family glycosyltransferase
MTEGRFLGKRSMDYRADEPLTAPIQTATNDATARARPILVAVPFYRNEQLVSSMVQSLAACAADLRDVRAEVIFYVDSPDHAPLIQALDAWLPAARAAFPCRVDRNAANLGFVRTMNLAIAEAVARGMDLLLLNSDTVMEPGSLPEMAALLAIDHMIGFVNPRSNNATITTLPVPARQGACKASLLAAARALAEKLPRFSYIPTAVGFCLLIRWAILAEFGGFDEIYGPGYNEENDLVMRAGRCGYRAVMANRAFVWHEGETSFALSETRRMLLEPVNRAILDARYPEFGGHTSNYYNSPEAIAERLLAALLPDEQGRLDFALDFSSFRTDHNGTFQAGRQLLQAAAIWRHRFNLHVICTQEVYDFHGYASLGVPRSDPHAARIFAAIFRVGQPYDWNVIQRLAISAPIIGIYMLDTISIDCPPLSSPRLYNIWQFALDHADLIVSQSRQTQAQLAARFTLTDHAILTVAPHSLDLADYALPGSCPEAAGAPPQSGGILVVGNHFHHKYLSQTANALAAAFPDRAVTAMGLGRAASRGPADPLAPPALAALPNLTPRAVGALTEAEIGACYAASDVVVFPSHAEGFGFPVLHALAARRPVMIRSLPVFRELWAALGHTPNMHFYDSTQHLIALLASPPVWTEHDSAMPEEGAERAARQIREAVEAAIRRADHGRIVRRIRAMQLASDLSDTGRGEIAHASQAAQVAQAVAQRVERVTRRVLSVPPVYRTARVLFRAARAGWRQGKSWALRAPQSTRSTAPQ